jgi:phosphohistidine phosphatase
MLAGAMRTLVLLRHSKAVRPHEADTDRVRGLTERGRREAAEAGEAIAKLGIAPKIGLVSPSRRTRETWDIASAAMPWRPRTVILDALYSAGPETIWEEAIEADPDGAEGVIVVGHNPGLAELASLLVRESHTRSKAARSLMEHLATSGFAAFQLAGETLAAPGPNLIGWGRLRED